MYSRHNHAVQACLFDWPEHSNGVNGSELQGTKSCRVRCTDSERLPLGLNLAGFPKFRYLLTWYTAFTIFYHNSCGVPDTLTHIQLYLVSFKESFYGTYTFSQTTNTAAIFNFFLQSTNCEGQKKSPKWQPKLPGNRSSSTFMTLHVSVAAMQSVNGSQFKFHLSV